MSLRALGGRGLGRWGPAVLLGILLLAGLAARLGRADSPLVSQAAMTATSQAAGALATTAPATQPAWPWAPPAGGKQGEVFKAEDDHLMWKMLASVVVILALAVPLVWLSRRLAPRIGAHAGKRMSLLETMYVGPRKSVHLVQVGSRRYLVGCSADRITTLAEVTAAFAEPREDQP